MEKYLDDFCNKISTLNDENFRSFINAVGICIIDEMMDRNMPKEEFDMQAKLLRMFYNNYATVKNIKENIKEIAKESWLEAVLKE